VRKILLLSVVLLLGGGYVVWSYWSITQLRSAVETGDIIALTQKVDWPSVQASVKHIFSVEMEKVRAQLPEQKSANFDGSLVPSSAALDRMLDEIVRLIMTPKGLLSMLPPDVTQKGADSRQRLHADAIKRASFVSPTRFEFEIGSADKKEVYFLGVMQLRDFEWKLTEIIPRQPMSTWGTPFNPLGAGPVRILPR
jgi:hypothetical protein